MPVGTKKDEEPIQKGHHEDDKKLGGHQEEEQKRPAADDAAANPLGAAGGEAEQKKEKKTPSVHITTPASGSAFPMTGTVPIGFECEGSGEFDAQIVVHDTSGKPVHTQGQPVKLDETGKGHGQAGISTEWLAAGKYEVHVFGSSGGEAAAIQKVQIELVDEEGKDEQAPAAGVEGADGGEPIETTGGGV